jgi:hypothetical protein
MEEDPPEEAQPNVPRQSFEPNQARVASNSNLQ